MIQFTLREILNEKKVSVNKISNATGISRQAVTAIVKNTSKGIQFETLEKIAEYLNIQPTKLIDDNSKNCSPIVKNNFISPPFYECSVCKNEQLERSRHNYCWVCGSKINWNMVVMEL